MAKIYRNGIFEKKHEEEKQKQMQNGYVRKIECAYHLLFQDCIKIPCGKGKVPSKKIFTCVTWIIFPVESCVNLFFSIFFSFTNTKVCHTCKFFRRRDFPSTHIVFYPPWKGRWYVHSIFPKLVSIDIPNAKLLGPPPGPSPPGP